MPGFSGGFVGVDIFFVISGYLMTGIIVKGLLNNQRITQGVNNKKFSIVSFYISRARRIVPALLVLCLALLFIGWFALSPLDLYKQGTHTISALGFFSNIQFFREAGYFDTSSHGKLLLHTWSLSVEWQFYLILPLLLWCAWKVRATCKMLIITVLLAFIASLALSVFISPHMPSASFYLLPTRAWEMLAGGLVYLLAERLLFTITKQRVLEFFGFSLIILSIILFNEQSNWPGWRAIIPVLGTVCVLSAARQNSLWINTVFAQRCGDWSYSLYLWHWPLAAGLVQVGMRGDLVATLICLLLTILLGWLSYRYVETPVRKTLSVQSNFKSFIIIGFVVFIIVIPSFFIRHYQGVPNRLPADVVEIFNEANNKNPKSNECFGKITDSCFYGGDTLGAIVIGDSHAGAFVRSVERALPSDKLHVLDWTMSGCITIKNIQRTDDKQFKCSALINEKLAESRDLDPLVPLLIINRTSTYLFGPNEPDRVSEVTLPTYFINKPYRERSSVYLTEMRDGIIKTACDFASVRPVYMIRPIPELKLHVPETMGKALWYKGEYSEVSISLKEYHQRHAFVWDAQDEAAKLCGVKILDPLPYLCSEGRCKGDVNGLPVYSDDDHLNERGTQILLPLLKVMFIETTNQ